MKGFLRTALDIKSPLFNAGMAKLEKSTGNSAIDVKIIADISKKAAGVMRQLGLDVIDTTGHELYYALQAATKRNDFEDLFIDCDYVIVIFDGQVISFNMIDIIENSHHEMPYEKQIATRGRRSLCGEILGRYLHHTQTNNQTVQEIAKSIGLIEDVCYNKRK